MSNFQLCVSGEDCTRGRRGGLFKCDTGSRSLDHYITNSCRPIGQLCVHVHAHAFACTCARDKLHNKQRSVLARDRRSFTSGDDTPPVVVRGSAGFSINYYTRPGNTLGTRQNTSAPLLQ